MRRWDLLLLAGCALVVAALVAVDWRIGAGVAGLMSSAAWYWLDDVDGEEG